MGELALFEDLEAEIHLVISATTKARDVDEIISALANCRLIA